jgi:hypothetical protein
VVEEELEEKEKLEALVEGMKQSADQGKEKYREMKEYVDESTGKKFDTLAGLKLYRKYVKDR